MHDDSSPVRRLLPPLVAFAAGWTLLAIGAVAAHVSPLAPASWVHWDAWLYLLQAKEGASLVSCDPRQTGDLTHQVVKEWCGTAGWMPVYPLLVRLGTRLGAAPQALAVVLSALFRLATLVLAWQLLRDRERDRAWAALLLVAVFPGAVYAHAAFPIALAHLLILGALAAALAKRWWLAGLLGALASATYATGFVIAPVLLAAAVLADRSTSRVRFVAPLVALAGLGAVLAYHHVATGRWDAFFLIQAKYGHGLSNPVATWWTSIAQIWTEWETHKRLAGVQTIVVSALVLTVVRVAWPLRNDARVRLFALAGLAWWGAPLVLGSGVALFRAESLVMPLALVFAWIPVRRSWPLVLTAAVVCPVIAAQFFLNALR